MAKVKGKIFDPDDLPKWLAAFWNKMFYQNIIAGINDDDCAILKVGREQIVITTDYLNANPIAVELGVGTYRDLGRLLVAVNFSDLCGTGATPIGFLSALAFDKKKILERDVKEFLIGVKYELKKHNVPLIGGDTKLGKSNSFCGIAIGIKERGTKLFFKNGARVGDSIWVSSQIGGVGAAIVGLHANNLDNKWNTWARRTIISPKLPLEKSRMAAATGKVNGGTDISDGLGADLWWMCEASGVGATIDVEYIPVADQVVKLAKRMQIPRWFYALTVGGDFQFLITANRKFDDKFANLGFFKLGEIIDEKETYLKIGSRSVRMPRLGHRDVNAKTFSEELIMIINRLKDLIE